MCLASTNIYISKKRGRLYPRNDSDMQAVTTHVVCLLLPELIRSQKVMWTRSASALVEYQRLVASVPLRCQGIYLHNTVWQLCRSPASARWRPLQRCLGSRAYHPAITLGILHIGSCGTYIINSMTGLPLLETQAANVEPYSQTRLLREGAEEHDSCFMRSSYASAGFQTPTSLCTLKTRIDRCIDR